MNVLEMVSAINPIAFEIGGFKVRWYGIIIAFAIYLQQHWRIKKPLVKGIEKNLSLI